MKYISRPGKLVSAILTLLPFFVITITPLHALTQGTELPKMPCDFVGYEARTNGLIVGDELSAKDEQGNELGKFKVCVDGQFGFLTIPADNPQTEEKDGAQENEPVSFYINGVEQVATANWREAGLVRVDLGIPKTPLTIEITSPQEESAVSANPITITGEVNNPQAQVKIILNNTTIFTPPVNPDGTFSVDNVNLAGGPNIIQASASDAARNSATSQISLYLGWVLHLKDVPWYEKERAHYSGAAICKMILDYLREENEITGFTQDELYNYGHPLNLSENATLLEMDPKAIDAILGHFDKYDTPGNWYDQRYGGGDPYHGYNFDVDVYDPQTNPSALNEYLRNIIHWIAYPVTINPWWLDGDLVAQPNSPAAVPIYGNYAHWITVIGAVTSADPVPYPRTNPWFTPEFTVYGFWLSDSASGGIGQDVYVTATEVGNTYFLPLNTNDRYKGKYLQVAEPPENESKAKVEIAPQTFNNSTLNLIKIAQDLEALGKINQTDLTSFEQRMQSLKSHLYDSARVVNLDKANPMPCLDTDLSYLFKDNLSSEPNTQGILWQEIIQPQALTDHDFREAIEDSIAREFMKVERGDNQGSYYIIPFDKYTKGQFLTYAAIIVDAQTGAFKQASWVEEPVRFVPIDKSQAEALAQDFCQDIAKSVHSSLIWQPQGPSNSPFFPYWKVTVDKHTFFVTQDGKVWNDDYTDEESDYPD